MSWYGKNEEDNDDYKLGQKIKRIINKNKDNDDNISLTNTYYEDE